MGVFHRVVLAFTAAVVVVFAAPSPAAAHGTLAMSNPASGTTLAAPVGSVELFFTEKVPDNAYFTVTAPGGGRVDSGWEHASPRPLDKPVTEYFMEGGKFEPRQYTTGFPARVRVAHLPAAGEYKVDYLSKASDGDSVHGTVTFKYTGPATPAPAGWTPPTDQADPALTGSGGPGPSAAAAPTATAAATPTAAAAPAQPQDDSGGYAWLGWLGGTVAAVAAVAGVVLVRRRRTPLPVVPIAVGAVVVALVGGYALGRATVPEQRAPVATGATGPAAVPAAAGAGHQHGGSDAGAATVDAAGTTVSAGGYTLQPVRRSQPAGRTVEYAFRIVGADRQPATRFAVVHDQPLHLVIAGRDLGGFQHLHPTMSPDGLWSVPLTLPRAGAYRIFADFTVATADGAPTPLVLGVDHLVPGTAPEFALPKAATQAQAGSFAVTMEGKPTIGATVPVSFRVARAGAPGPATLERYLGAYGHLVVLREGDLGYVHVHPDQELVDGAIRFNVSVPGAGRYRAFLEFQVAGGVNRAEFTLDLS
ncbi:copper resistance protein CopC [Actinoplanes sp. M2I2]|uniref:copper resistance CopC family protein n=1 Tax=Actinoplanes sp. M2I2 TaxID=1734444 RepID=UPI002020250D|nr:copper resistance protein CopC [Actinoplanes sp. M2I2]